MDRLLGHLAQFGSFSQQGELLCTQGLAYLLRDAEGERVFTDLISRATGHSLGPGLSWQAEPRQEDQGRPDLEGRNAEGQPVVKIEAKLGAPFGQGQLESYVSALCAGGQGGTLLIVVPKSRLEEITGHASAHFGIAGAGPWRILREAVEIPCSVVTWEDLLEALSTVASERFRDDLSQFRAMYRVFNGDDMEPLTSDEQVLAWRDREAWWGILVEHATRALTAPGDHVLPFGVERGAQPYRRRYVCRLVSQEYSCYSVGTRDPFQNHRTPIWLRFNRSTGHFVEIAGRLERSALGAVAVRSQGDLWFPLEVPLNADRVTMIRALVAQVQRIVIVAYPPAALSRAATHSTSMQGFPDHVRAFVDRERWTFAKTMPEWPHEYLVRSRVDETLFEAAVVHIRAYGYEGRFYLRPITYFEEDDWVYWTMGAPIAETTIINRCRREDTYEARGKAGTLPT